MTQEQTSVPTLRKALHSPILLMDGWLGMSARRKCCLFMPARNCSPSAPIARTIMDLWQKVL